MPGMLCMSCCMLCPCFAFSSVALRACSISSVVSSRAGTRDNFDKLRTCGSAELFGGNGGGSGAAQPVINAPSEIAETKYKMLILFIAADDARAAARALVSLTNLHQGKHSDSHHQRLRVVSDSPPTACGSLPIAADSL